MVSQAGGAATDGAVGGGLLAHLYTATLRVEPRFAFSIHYAYVRPADLLYDGPVGNFVRADSDALEFDCGACPQQAVTLAVTSESWLIFHLLLSFVLVAYVRWSRVEIHNHACNQYELPPCCQQHLQQHQAQHKDVVEEKHNVVEVDVKENEVLLPTTATPMQTPEEEHAAARLETLRVEYASYLQMLKFRFPRVVVDHKMRADGKNPKVLDELIAVSSTAPKEKKLPGPIAIPPAAEPVEDAEHTQKIETFRRMLKVGVPRHLVEMKARKEGVDPAELNGSTSSHTIQALQYKLIRIHSTLDA
ncbi:hypothetical protein BBJ29_007035 [Phytophthora kernoviae]|uniref:Uncharacterized protein n=1 Tax=Phytophthora kernoviae TaxID=325452 RepID=A0A3F2RTZ9_9STRA|nr:hypothetical protein BBP00_00003638 [Phytophthora kernoviae]RLN68055.1 hypothetical protein BBJ29_007035 [Phytophthora kernoviae]